jgi:hypothetical protein
MENFRYERKFYISGMERAELESILRFHPAIFTEIYHERTVNNIYFDSFNRQHYFSNINGEDRRLKVRIRWYGELFGDIKNPVLELKLKHNQHVSKLLHPLRPFVLDASFSIDLIRQIFRESPLSETLRLYLEGLEFSLLNSYNRKYFLSSDRQYRTTVDTDMKVYELSNRANYFMNNLKDHRDIILEIKYNKSQDELVDSITGYLPFRLTRSSKYADGLTKLSA